MDLFQTGMLIRVSIVLGSLGLLVIAGALFALRERRRVAKSAADTPESSPAGLAVLDGGPRQRGDCGPLEANDSGESAPVMHRRAA